MRIWRLKAWILSAECAECLRFQLRTAAWLKAIALPNNLLRPFRVVDIPYTLSS